MNNFGPSLNCNRLSTASMPEHSRDSMESVGQDESIMPLHQEVVFKPTMGLTGPVWYCPRIGCCKYHCDSGEYG